MLSQAENYIVIVFRSFSFIAMNSNTPCIRHKILSSWQLGWAKLFRFIFIDFLTEMLIHLYCEKGKVISD